MVEGIWWFAIFSKRVSSFASVDMFFFLVLFDLETCVAESPGFPVSHKVERVLFLVKMSRETGYFSIIQCLKFFGFSGEITPKRKTSVSFRTKKISKKRKTLN